MPREKWERSTFRGTHHRPQRPEHGRSQRELRERASFDNEPATGCGALFLLMVTVAAILAGVVT